MIRSVLLKSKLYQVPRLWYIDFTVELYYSMFYSEQEEEVATTGNGSTKY